jgi:dienelactone hydrolase
LTSGSGTPFSVVAEVHPSFVDAKDAEAITVPICMLASKDEDAGEIERFHSKLKVPNHVETFDGSVHGWMGAR